MKICPHCKKVIFDEINERDIEVLKIVLKDERNITEIQKKLKIAYKNTWFRIKKLMTMGLVTTNKIQSAETGRPVYIRITKKGNELLRKIE